MNDIEKLFDYYTKRFPWADDVLIECLIKKDLERTEENK